MNLNAEAGAIFKYDFFFLQMLEDGNTKTHCSEMNDDIRLYMTFETLVLISCTDDTKCKGMIRTFQ